MEDANSNGKYGLERIQNSRSFDRLEWPSLPGLRVRCGRIWDLGLPIVAVLTRVIDLRVLVVRGLIRWPWLAVKTLDGPVRHKVSDRWCEN
jgi:hypothetical protein